ncbi:uncharacterized protein TNIN_162411 [Trichonephila inaurata madagascariensis]|uniref:Reverse transcriptase domain-containing protein n=1 Tax=Trichonephila inaurata madagascariensis TaxID=2747483 RepID=A0A8X7CRQ4_9ARAC|nr:uncharacterized protein TNIN_162411 [Trichonephila inaurata madagascariensis]
MATNSIFGEILQGRINNEGNVKEVQVNYLSTIDQKMDYDQINKFWELENMGINKQESSNSDLQILEKFEENTTYTNGRYETKLLWKDDKIQLSNNYEVAKRRLFNLNDKFKRDKGLYLNYKEIIQQQLKDGIVEFTDCEPNKTCPGYFMPHHAVIRKEKETTKVRICFDASSKSRDQLSLNDLLYCGPNLNPELLRIILKFRIEKIAMCADIQRAFLEIGIKEEDRIYLQFLWGHDNGTCLDLEGQPVRVLRMTRVPFGVNCSPFLLAATIRTHLEKYEHFEVTEKLRDLYVDDFLCSVDSLAKAKQFVKDATYILSEAGMNLRKWITSSAELRKQHRNDTYILHSFFDLQFTVIQSDMDWKDHPKLEPCIKTPFQVKNAPRYRNKDLTYHFRTGILYNKCKIDSNNLSFVCRMDIPYDSDSGVLCFLFVKPLKSLHAASHCRCCVTCVPSHQSW